MRRITFIGLLLLISISIAAFVAFQRVSARRGSPAAPFAAIVVNDLGDNTTAGDNKCTLREAINNANTNSDTTGGDCLGGSGADTITFSVSGTIFAQGTFPGINSDITIDGSGQNVTISGDSDNNGTADVHLFDSNAVTWHLNNLTIAKGFIPASGVNGRGGAIATNGTNLSIYRVTFTGNNASHSGACCGGGGAIFWSQGTVTIDQSTFIGNDGRFGGAIFGGGGPGPGVLNITNSTFTQNTAEAGGAVGISEPTTATASNTTFYGNSSGLQGGALFVGQSSGATPVFNFINVTLAHNTAGDEGGGIYNLGIVNATNSIIAANQPGASCGGNFNICNKATFNDNGHNIISNTDPGLDPTGPQNNGGPTKTVALLQTSTALDAADDAVCAAAPVSGLDQRGVTRPQSTHCDIGAYEADGFQVGPNYVVNTLADTNDGFCSVLGQGAGNKDCTLREAINTANAVSGANTITFNLSGTITLGSALPSITDDVTINGTGQSITVSGNNSFRVLTVNSGTTFNLLNLTIANGLCNSCDGGGLNNNGGTVNVTDSTFSNNHLNSGTNDHDGGGIFNSGVLNVTGSTFTGNSSVGSGGGIANEGTLTVTNSTFSGNTAPTLFGGGIINGHVNNSATLNLINSTFSGNSASAAGGVMIYSGTLNFANTIIAGSSPADCFSNGAIGTNKNNLVQDGSCSDNGVNFSSGNPLLGALANNGGPTQTVALNIGSPAINTADDATCAAAVGSPTFGAGGKDQRGVTRPQGTHCDIGAFESNYAIVATAGTPQSTTVGNAFATNLAATVTENGNPLSGVSVTFTAPASGASGTFANTATNTETVSTNASGVATASQFTANHTSGSYSVTAAVTGLGSATFSLTNNPDVVTHFGVVAPPSTTAGSAFSFTVTAQDQFNNTVTGYAGTVHFTKSDSGAGSAVPADSTLTNGVGTFSANLVTAGNQTITATDTVNGSITGISDNILVNPATATHFAVNAPSTATAGSAFNFTVTAQDQFNNTDTAYAGTVVFSSSDGAAVLPGNSSLVNGVGTFSATLKTAGNQTITATDQGNNSITGTSNNILVSPAAATHFAVSAPSSATAGFAFSFTVTAQDQFDNTATGYGGQVHFTKTDGGAGSAVPSNSTLVNGVGTFSATLVTAGNQTITATDTVNSAITGTSNTILVSPGQATHFSVNAPGTAQAGVAFNFTVTAQDQFNNTVTGYGGQVKFSSSDGGAVLPAQSPLVNGVGTFSATLNTAGNQTITATDSVNGSITGTSNTINVTLVNLTISKTHSGNFTQADTGKTYTITVSNIGANASSGSVTVTDNLPAGLTATGWGGTGWNNCSLTPVTGPATLTCDRADSVAANSAFPTITLTVDVSCTAAASITNTATVAGGNDTTPGNNVSNDVTTINPNTVPPVIVCPGGISKFTDSGQVTATINLTPPVATDNCVGVSVTGVRSDGKPLNAPFPIGITIIKWTAKDSSNNTAECAQSVTVMAPSSRKPSPSSQPDEEESLLILTDVLMTVLNAVW